MMSAGNGAGASQGNGPHGLVGKTSVLPLSSLRPQHWLVT
jgi:hypothetical protein